ncbi:PadR family transcriptional regulator [Nonomuraea glycinis]|uniref:Transcription regulator PadR N-terminal domain-containing protein n=1 Tax=Nonomuraea glycinis TaxID=2047744 RepID=A0A918A7Q8_9ACTN|nr:PadR family transcriptional regulator [Nonomuraea glycinis]MCA2179472.1 PadR family transcriptional regulator [Nonomuraea glycinis]GGP09666.1 hypothetical protein GCM10012278_46030 [Nonomuraea glycinis]
MRFTTPTLLVLQAFLADPREKRYGFELVQVAGLEAGTLYPILMRLEEAGWLESSWEEVDPRAEGRPRRRYYRLTAVGEESARVALAARAARLRLGPLRQPAPGAA